MEYIDLSWDVFSKENLFTKDLIFCSQNVIDDLSDYICDPNTF
jgi:hypothetical protein